MNDVSLFIDFDGTISPVDISNTFFTRYAGPDAAAAVLDWKRGLISSCECLQRELDAYRGDIRDLRKFARERDVDRGFYALKRECDRRKVRIFIVSDGLDFYIEPFLSKHSINEPLLTNRLDLVNGKPHLSFPHFNKACGRCANCKSSHVRAQKDKGRPVIYVGDGLSDKCAASVSDLVFAKGDLAAYCEESGIPYTGFACLDEVAESLRFLDPAAIAKPE
jgi:2-hydroxy-3-keto-5-methylthiopentenyl-1-phosphate phosphatase